MSFTHCEVVSARNAPDEMGQSGHWDVMREDDGTYSVFDQGGGLHVGVPVDTLVEAKALAEAMAEEFDARHMAPAPGM